MGVWAMRTESTRGGDGGGGVGRIRPHPHIPRRVGCYSPTAPRAVRGKKLRDPPVSLTLTQRASTNRWAWPMPTVTPPPPPNANLVSDASLVEPPEVMEVLS